MKVLLNWISIGVLMSIFSAHAQAIVPDDSAISADTQDYEYVPLAEENKVWCYSDNTKLYLKDDKTIGEKTYKECYSINGDNSESFICYIREEDKKVYVKFSESDERLIYDFNLGIGDLFSNEVGMSYSIESIEYITVADKLRKRFVCDATDDYINEKMYLIEGIGAVSDLEGFFYDPFPYIASGLNMSLPVFVRQETLAGDLIFTPAGNIFDVSDSGCKENITEIEPEIKQPDEYLNVILRNGVAHFSMTDIYLHCGFDGLNVSIDIDNDNLRIVLHSHMPPADCMCRYDIEFKSTEIKAGNYNLYIELAENSDTPTQTIGYYNGKLEIVENQNTTIILNDPTDILKINNLTDINLQFERDFVSFQCEGKIALSVYDLGGVKIAEADGEERVEISTETLPIGIYLVEATAPDGSKSRKKIAVK